MAIFIALLYLDARGRAEDGRGEARDPRVQADGGRHGPRHEVQGGVQLCGCGGV